jgi:tyrosinase
MDSPLSRRNFLGVAGLAVSFGMSARSAADAPGASPAVLMRRNINGKDAKADLDAYATAIAKMKDRPDGDRLSWPFQAGIHGTSCPHSNWWFLPWHRAYLFYFEKICRKLSGKRDFALPYWDWSEDQTIPAPFLDKTSSLYWANRQRDKLSQDRVGRREVIEPTVLAEPNFLVMGSRPASRLRDKAASGALEAPHNYVHGTIGGDMGFPDTAALDPVFWVHHAFIDRVWAEWQLSHSAGLPVADVWLNTPMTFYDADGERVRTSTSEFISTAELGYEYEGLRRLFLGGHRPRIFAQTAPLAYQAEITLQQDADRTLDPAGRKAVVTVTLADIPELLRKRLARAATGDEIRELSVPLTLDDIQVDTDVNYGVRVFLNAPDPKNLPGVDSPHYVGTVDFFAVRHEPGGHGAKAESASTSAALSLSRPLAAIGKGFDSKKPLVLHCQAVPIGGADPKGKVKLTTVRVEAVTAGER